MKERILVTGATGYIGGRLVPHLLDDGAEVVCLVRQTSTFARRFADDVTIARGSAENPDEVAAAADGCSVAYYLIHSLGGEDFQQRDREMAESFRHGCEQAGVERIVYLGGLGDEDADLSPHLLSRQETGRTLAAGTTPVTELRAAIIIGSGSASFEMLRSLTEVLPVMTTPSWVNRTRCQPTGIRDVIAALMRARHRDVGGHDVLELGGPDVVTYREMMDVYAQEARLPRRRIIGVPVLSPWLSSHWVSLVTPLPSVLATQLVGSLVNDVVVTRNSAVDALALDPITFAESVRIAVSRVDDLVIPTSWSAGYRPDVDGTPDPDDPDWAGGHVLEDVRSVCTSTATTADIFSVLIRLGGETGWMWGNWLWGIRGVLDQLWGGAGLRRGRRHPSELTVGDAVDFWRVVELEPDEHLRLLAEMKLPGYAWLEWSLTTDAATAGEVTMTQRARYIPRGLFGRIYWYVLVPFHQILFPRLASRIVARAEATAEQRAGNSPPELGGEP
ncbi:SDR family oxidoreductase [Ilumatobacter sp.]|uniref:SDR family oxidoreductase n=1 Tax=Ilumatobacter sp. TaxID=1967498 RepID=UPI003C370FA6